MVKSDWNAWNVRSLAEEPIVRLILDGTVVCVRLDRKATSISLLVVIGGREDGQKVLLAIKGMGGESAEAWRGVLDDLMKRGLRRPEFFIVDGAPGLEKAIAAVLPRIITPHPSQRLSAQKRKVACRFAIRHRHLGSPGERECGRCSIAEHKRALLKEPNPSPGLADRSSGPNSVMRSLGSITVLQKI